MLNWLRKDVYRLRLSEQRDLIFIRAHVLLALLVALGVGLAIGLTTGHFAYPYRTLPRPPLPAGQTAPAPDCVHVMGGCLPKPKTPKAAGDPAIQGPDLSNNNPIYSRAAWAAIGAHNRFAIFKVVEGTGYVDQTARSMVIQARIHHLAVGGYDFLHVCLVSPAAEAHLFVVSLQADGLTGSGTLPPVGDAEYPPSLQCNARAWISAWAGAVYAALRRFPMIYTGAWWWQPHLGAFWPAHALAWISGYGVRYPFMPSGRSQLDMWQFSDHGWNGYNATDLSVWRDGAPAFNKLIGQVPPKPKPSFSIYPHTVFVLPGGVRASESGTVGTWDRSHCRNPVRRPVCKSSHLHLALLADRIWFVAHHRVVRGRWVPVFRPRWGTDQLGQRFQGIERRLHQK